MTGIPKHRIMIVEDEVVVSIDLRVKLEKLGYEVTPKIVRYGEKVLETAKVSAPDLILMDIRLMGEMDGVTAAGEIRKHLQTPVVFLTAFSDEETLKRAKTASPFGYLKKPVRLDDLRITIEVSLCKAEMEKELRRSELNHRMVADFTYDWESWVSPEGGYVYSSPSCFRITGHSREEFFKNPGLLFEMVHPDDKAGFMEHIERYDSRNADVGQLEFRILHADGSIRWIEHICQPVYGPDGAYMGQRSSNRDITGRKAAQAEREDLIVRLKEALANVKTLSGLLPICANCKKIRDDRGYWKQLEYFISEHSEARFSHGICPECIKKLYPGIEIPEE